MRREDIHKIRRTKENKSHKTEELWEERGHRTTMKMNGVPTFKHATLKHATLKHRSDKHTDT